MTTVFARLLLFLSSYFPLFVIYFVLYIAKEPRLAWCILGLGFVGLIGFFAFLRSASQFAPRSVEVKSVQRRDGEAMSYIVTYLVPFISTSFTEWQQIAALLILFFVLALLYTHSHMLHLNPMLNAIGYHLCEITLADGSIHSLIIRRPVRIGERISAVSLAPDILLEQKP